jgi:hypothetical protein
VQLEHLKLFAEKIEPGLAMMRSDGRGRGGREIQDGRGRSGRFGPQRGSTGAPRYQNVVKIIDRDPGEGVPIWMGGASSSWVMAKPYLINRAKEAGVWSYWTGVEDTDFPVRRPTMVYHYDSHYQVQKVRYDTTRGCDMLAWGRLESAPSGATAPQSVVDGTYRVWRDGDYVTDEDPFYDTVDGETDMETGIAYGTRVRMTSDFVFFEDYVSDLQDRTLKWISASNKHQERVSKASAVLLGCLGPTPSALVKALLADDRVHKAWEALCKRYGPTDNSKAISELQLQLKNLPLRGATKLLEYLSDFAVLQSALHDCGVIMGSEEAIGIIEETVMKVADARIAYESAFTNARQMHWDVEFLLGVLSEESQSLLQKMGIEQLKSIEFNQETARRAKVQPHKQESPYQRNPSAASAEGDAQGKQGGASIIKGSDGMLHSDIKCYKCNNNGHYAKHCPTKKSPVVNSSEVPVAEPVEALKGASANTTTGPYSTVGAKGEPTNAAFTVEIDDNWDEESSANPAYLTDVETLELMDRGKGPGPE